MAIVLRMNQDEVSSATRARLGHAHGDKAIYPFYTSQEQPATCSDEIIIYRWLPLFINYTTVFIISFSDLVLQCFYKKITKDRFKMQLPRTLSSKRYWRTININLIKNEYKLSYNMYITREKNRKLLNHRLGLPISVAVY